MQMSDCRSQDWELNRYLKSCVIFYALLTDERAVILVCLSDGNFSRDSISFRQKRELQASLSHNYPAAAMMIQKKIEQAFFFSLLPCSYASEKSIYFKQVFLFKSISLRNRSNLSAT